jgi:hypothetical protein
LPEQQSSLLAQGELEPAQVVDELAPQVPSSRQAPEQQPPWLFGHGWPAEQVVGQAKPSARHPVCASHVAIGEEQVPAALAPGSVGQQRSRRPPQAFASPVVHGQPTSGRDGSVQ